MDAEREVIIAVLQVIVRNVVFVDPVLIAVKPVTPDDVVLQLLFQCPAEVVLQRILFIDFLDSSITLFEDGVNAVLAEPYSVHYFLVLFTAVNRLTDTTLEHEVREIIHSILLRGCMRIDVARRMTAFELLQVLPVLMANLLPVNAAVRKQIFVINGTTSRD
ncbi:hypothetical protein KY092_08065 [Natronomonas gomsonensis]|uniref:hypothetical protein n=1 Tax=Natronomonas gomsonensis TaxID=1046043 RepID=UPI0020CA4554|nr:hypothetical protein [Natronomonas gomsonensis]MCY4730512.1 hypothetical protein [Natronomonas gomsonensis]